MIRKVNELCKKHNIKITFQSNPNGSMTIISESSEYKDIQNVSVEDLQLPEDTLVNEILNEIDSVFSGL